MFFNCSILLHETFGGNTMTMKQSHIRITDMKYGEEKAENKKWQNRNKRHYLGESLGSLDIDR